MMSNASARVTILSPHRDDAAFSCGLLIASLLRASCSVHIVNIFTVSAYAPYLTQDHADWQQQVCEARYAEDERFVERLRMSEPLRGNIHLMDLDWLDLPLRWQVPEQDALAAFSLRTSEVEALRKSFSELPHADVVLVPMALGGHLDHRLTCHAAQLAFPTSRLAFYEDLPYACGMERSPWSSELDGEVMMHEMWIPGGEPDALLKRDLCRCYPSQIEDSLAEAMAQHGQKHRGERIVGSMELLAKVASIVSFERIDGMTPFTSLPEISILMTAWNTAPYVAESLESVLQQKTARAWELLFVDDGSDDGTLAIAQQYSSRYPERIRVLRHDGGRNQGISASRNLALRHAQGSYIAFLDSDDVWLPNHLEVMSKFLDSMPLVAMVYAAAERWVDTNLPFDEAAAQAGRWGGNYLPPIVPEGELPGMVAPGKLLQWFLADESMVPCICTVMARTAAVRSVDGFCEDFRGLYDDQTFHAKLAARYWTFVHDGCVARYRQHPASCCARAREDVQSQLGERRRFDSFLASRSDLCVQVSQHKPTPI